MLKQTKHHHSTGTLMLKQTKHHHSTRHTHNEHLAQVAARSAPDCTGYAGCTGCGCCRCSRRCHRGKARQYVSTLDTAALCRVPARGLPDAGCAHTHALTHGLIQQFSRAVLDGRTCCASSAAPPSAGAAGRIPAGGAGRIRTGYSRTWPRCRPVLDLCAAEPLSASERAFQKTLI